MELFYEKNNLLSNKQFDNHIKLYEGYIDKVNKINEKHESFQNASIMSNFQYNLNGIILHELYFKNITVQNSINYDYSVIFNNFEYFEDWKQDFISIAKNTRGWVIYCYEPRTKQYMITSLKDHSDGIICNSIPIIVLDMYEHAYYTDYGNNKEKYINNFIDNIDWVIVQNRVESKGRRI